MGMEAWKYDLSSKGKHNDSRLAGHLDVGVGRQGLKNDYGKYVKGYRGKGRQNG